MRLRSSFALGATAVVLGMGMLVVSSAPSLAQA
jgi:hypothetical protein